METSIITAPEHYNPNQLVTYKVINSDGTTYPTEKVNQIEYALHVAREDRIRMNDLQSTINKIIDNLTTEYWYNPNVEKSDVLNEICDILGHEPKKHVRITADVRLEIDYEMPLAEAEDFDARDFLQDNLSVDSYHGDLEVDLFEVQSADVYED